MIPFPDKKYDIIYADPPWQYENIRVGGELSSGASQKYSTMSLEEIKQLPVSSIAENDSVLFLWATVPLLPEALEVLNSWGFKYKTMLTWDKQANGLGMGYWFRTMTEHLLLGVKGKVKAFHLIKQPNILRLTVKQHSSKPYQFRHIIDQAAQVFEQPKKIELFARDKIDGWDQWGNQVPKYNIVDFCK